MLEPERAEVLRHLAILNSWWSGAEAFPARYASLRPRPFLDLFEPWVTERRARRAIVLLGLRQVGKTTLLHHTVRRLLRAGVDPRRVAYLSLDRPLLTGRSLEDLLDLCGEAAGIDFRAGEATVFFDEVQYLPDWEVHLKSLVDQYPDLKCVASGSAAAALRLRSRESGAGRFSEFLLPPLAFFEYLALSGEYDSVEWVDADRDEFAVPDMPRLNRLFLDYLNFGGFPEALTSQLIRNDPGQLVKGDILDKILLRDLPSLYGIEDVQELNALFTVLAFNSGQELALDELSQRSRVSTNTLKRYLEYLEAAFLVRRVHRIDQNGRRFQRASFFKVYLTSPALRCALFSPVAADDEATGPLVETAVFAQWLPAESRMHYARSKRGEVEIDFVDLDARLRPARAVEVKWSDRFVDRPRDLTSLVSFCREHGLPGATVTTRTRRERREVDGVEIRFEPASLFCFREGLAATETRRLKQDGERVLARESLWRPFDE